MHPENQAPDLGTIEEACEIIGGKKNPIDKATYYRGAKQGRYPAPVKVSPNVSRVDLNKVRAIAKEIADGKAA